MNLLQAFEKLRTRHARHGDIEQCKMDRPFPLPAGTQRGWSVDGRDHDVAVTCQGVSDDAQNDWLVIGDKDDATLERRHSSKS